MSFSGPIYTQIHMFLTISRSGVEILDPHIAVINWNKSAAPVKWTNKALIQMWTSIILLPTVHQFSDVVTCGCNYIKAAIAHKKLWAALRRKTHGTSINTAVLPTLPAINYLGWFCETTGYYEEIVTGQLQNTDSFILIQYAFMSFSGPIYTQIHMFLTISRSGVEILDPHIAVINWNKSAAPVKWTNKALIQMWTSIILLPTVHQFSDVVTCGCNYIKAAIAHKKLWAALRRKTHGTSINTGG
ncbi:hypothetical protein J6590_067776 [Homalodisca vitripennis]|nr:hypothetical protein J6590_067776 [Homalodisca vitripennis]